MDNVLEAGRVQNRNGAIREFVLDALVSDAISSQMVTQDHALLETVAVRGCRANAGSTSDHHLHTTKEAALNDSVPCCVAKNCIFCCCRSDPRRETCPLQDGTLELYQPVCSVSGLTRLEVKALISCCSATDGHTWRT